MEVRPLGLVLVANMAYLSLPLEEVQWVQIVSEVSSSFKIDIIQI